MTDTPMSGPGNPGARSEPMTVETRAIIAANRHVEGKKSRGGVPEDVVEYLRGAEGDDAELTRRLKLIGATPEKKPAPPMAIPPASATPPKGEAPKEPERPRPIWRPPY